MDPTITASIIGAAGTIVAAVVGVVFGRRSEWLDRLLRPTRIVDLRGDWESTWFDKDDGREKSETITIIKVWKNRLEGEVKSVHYEGKPCRVEGLFSGRFLQLIYLPTKKTASQLIDDYGCYFFEKQGDGTFKGYSIGFRYDLNQTTVLEHSLKRI